MWSTHLRTNFAIFGRLPAPNSSGICCKSPIVSAQTSQARNISMTIPLQRVKRKQRTYQPIVRRFTEYGDTHRLLRGMCMNGERYGPLVELPDYTFLDGRPTPLTPIQRQLMDDRKRLAEKVFKDLHEMEVVKDYNKLKEQQNKEEKEVLIKKKLKPKNKLYNTASK